ncbi:hypothetical protein ACWT_3376 [Actinoplanes sp. SE50]|uniref:hypothetical protein n=1 Tax=unclassified Actinoplanes TaxID=2626549 RepID=UPI00023ED229|nr:MULTISPECIES: hypothetical protein [unclassified Actinoplanes]AEV84399.1 hypothetical protein ACPL_3504 [Actinoplanes sp. SE50/110]ATO82791.1 hypothetical protein ACWT_3376 [Actinoplanes sp. SE50]SLM00199.1 hypothetical protein ACSP50_3431 [Actinoplanes sp. SE50/110]
MRASRLARILAAALTVAALTVGCDSSVPSQSNVTQHEAEQRVADRAQEALQQLPSGASLKVTLNEPKLRCEDNGDRTFVENQYAIEYPKGWPVQQAVPTLAGYWTGKGYKILRDERDDPKLARFGVEYPDEFRISIEVIHRDNGRVDAYLISSSPCI